MDGFAVLHSTRELLGSDDVVERGHQDAEVIDLELDSVLDELLVTREHRAAFGRDTEEHVDVAGGGAPSADLDVVDRAHVDRDLDEVNWALPDLQSGLQLDERRSQPPEIGVTPLGAAVGVLGCPSGPWAWAASTDEDEPDAVAIQ